MKTQRVNLLLNSLSSSSCCNRVAQSTTAALTKRHAVFLRLSTESNTHNQQRRREFSLFSKPLFHKSDLIGNSSSTTTTNNNNIGTIYIERTNIAIVGAMNSGKSTLMNCLTNSNTSIVDSTPGTTADVKMTTMELHGIGPTKIFDTPGTDESSDLGEKKRQKTLIALKESDIVVIVVDPFNTSSVQQAKWLLGECEKNERPFCILFNVSELKRLSSSNNVQSMSDKLDAIETELKINEFDSQPQQGNKYFCGTTCVDLESKIAHSKCIKFIEDSHKKSKINLLSSTSSAPMYPTRLLPNLTKDSTVFLNIPMDEETPSGRLLKPQAMVHEYLLREYSNVFSYRMNLKHARSSDKELVEKEKKRFLEAIKTLNSNGKLQLLITDSQAMDIVHPWTIDETTTTNNPIIDITTFSVVMINFMSNGRLSEFLKGIEAFKALQSGDSVLLCEACNHNRIADDIGTVQIPRAIEKRFGSGNIKVDIVFGREYQLIKDLSQYKLIIHCGGCMIDKQKMNARLSDLSKAGVPITNYGLLLSFLQSEKALSRVTKPWLNVPSSQ